MFPKSCSCVWYGWKNISEPVSNGVHRLHVCNLTVYLFLYKRQTVKHLSEKNSSGVRVKFHSVSKSEIGWKPIRIGEWWTHQSLLKHTHTKRNQLSHNYFLEKKTWLCNTYFDFAIYMERRIVGIVISSFLFYTHFRSKTGLKLAHKGNCEGDLAYSGWLWFYCKKSPKIEFILKCEYFPLTHHRLLNVLINQSNDIGNSWATFVPSLLVIIKKVIKR